MPGMNLTLGLRAKFGGQTTGNKQQLLSALSFFYLPSFYLFAANLPLPPG
jgi:hypothetical protein